MSQQWDPITVLNITKTRTMCCGWAPSQNRDCHNPVAAANRLEAHRLLDKLAACSPSSDRVLSRLNKIARCLLCRRNHQDQAESVVDKWRKRISDFVQSRVDPHEEDSDADDAAGGEHAVDLREQVAECQRLLTRVATALESHQDAQRHFETFSVGSDTSTDTVRAQSSVETETTPSESTRDDAEAEHGNEPLATGLNLDHVQMLVRRLTLEHEANRLRRSRTVRFEEDQSHQDVLAPAPSSTGSSRTIIPGEPSPEPQVSERDQRVEGRTESPTTFPEVEGRNDTSDGPSSSETTAPMAIGVAEDENVPGNYSHSLTHANLSPWYSGLDYARSTLFGRDGRDGTCDDIWHPRQSQSSRRYTNPMWLAAVALYLGVLFAWYRLQVLQTSGPRRLTLDGPVTHQISAVAGQTDMGGPVLSSLVIVRE